MNDQWLDALMCNKAMRIGQTGAYIIRFKPIISFKDDFRRVASRQHAQYMLNGQAATPDDGFSAKYLWIYRNTF